MPSSPASLTQPAPRVAVAAPSTRWLALGVVLIGTLTGTLANSMANVALPSVMGAFNVSVGDALWLVTLYVLMFSVPMPVFGRLGDLYGYKRIYLISLSLFAVFSLLAGLAPNFPMLLFFRALQGLANAPTLPVVMGIIALLFPAGERGQALGMWAFVNSASHAVGPPLSGFLVQYWSWQAMFLILVPVSLLGVILVARWVPSDTRQGSGGFDYAGAGTFTLAMLGLMAALTQGPKVGWVSGIVLFSGAAFVGLMVTLAFIERRASAPFIDTSLLRNRPYAAAVGVISLQLFLQFGLALVLPLFLVQIQGQSSSVTGLVVFSLPMTMAVVAPFAGRLADRRGNRLISASGMGIVAAGALAMTALAAATSAIAVIPVLVLIGIGMGFVQSPTAAAVTQVAPQEKLGVALGLYNMLRFVGGMLGTTILGILLDVGSPQLGLLGAFRVDFGLTAILAGAAALLALSLPKAAASRR
jgi:EmrB/QacA subfamily drug resistance transporter